MKNLLIIIHILAFSYFISCKPLVEYCTIDGECTQEKQSYLKPNQPPPDFCEVIIKNNLFNLM